jgi:O-antigen ligase
MSTLANSMFSTVEHNPARFNLQQSLFLITVVLAPLEIRIGGSFTVYDALIMVLALLAISTGERKLKFLPQEFQIAIFFYLLFALLSAFRATHPLEALTLTLQFVFIFFIQLPVIITLVRSPSMLRWSVFLLLVGSLMVNGWSMYFQEEGYHNRIRTFVSGNSNRLGYPTSYLSPFVLYLLIDGWRRGRFFIMIFVAIVIYMLLWALAASGSRSSTVGTLIALLVFLVFRHGVQINLKFLGRTFLMLISIAGISYLMYHSAYFPSILHERIEKTLMFQESLTADRTRLALAGFRAFMESPFVGVGFDNFRHVATQYDVPLVTEQTPHNIWVQFLAQTGIFGTLAFLFLIGIWFKRLLQRQRIINDPSQRDMLWAIIASMVAIMTIFMFIPIMSHRHYWLIYGLGLAAVYSVSFAQRVHVKGIPEQSKFNRSLR